MPLNSPAITLRAGPEVVQDARRWVVDAFLGIDRRDLVECGEMGVSELVTNALLHGEQPIQVRLRGTQQHPRVEVRDASTDPPELPTPASGEDLDELLLTFGRGLGIVARASEAWGAEIEDDGKVVWFAPAPEVSEDHGQKGRITGSGPGTNEQTDERPSDLVEILLLDVPVDEYLAFQRYFRELRREVRLLALAHESDYPLAKQLSATFDRLDRFLRVGVDRAEIPSRAAPETGAAPTTDLVRVMSAARARRAEQFAELLDLTDAFCREEKLLALARTPEQRAFQNWFLTELVRQARGEPAQPYPRSPGEERRTGAL